MKNDEHRFKLCGFFGLFTFYLSQNVKSKLLSNSWYFI